eukprot:Gregarina_sp_Poly_1__11281@NODE_937_length_5654_cov_79_487918_g663_i0_p3_GENE_NODE_937_length_5654_cov_79_487918_g663_i0NODE_937_length_5654_cov_79_487918_g663_i0_p3_ORF_typecomplete_len311_score53_62Ras/PF00071_22/7_7e29Arf/PF00025_21/1_7e06Roc/PF08477_13/8_8e05FeoB_N/PF02421_18/0_0014RsgA_GTPase/PF03193_16/0_0037GTP_EFTU/PF00009_27/0_19_NODE_937_length_5654_cov_79_487918_g663_i01281060
MGVVLVFDVTSPESFENVSYWLESLANHASEDICKIIVGNKVDLANRQVSRKRAEALASHHGLRYFETSALTNSGVREIFESLARDIRARQLSQEDKNADSGRFQLNEIPPSNDAKSIVCCGLSIRRVGSSPAASPSRNKRPAIKTSGDKMTGDRMSGASSSGMKSSDSRGPTSPQIPSFNGIFPPRSRIQKSPVFLTAANGGDSPDHGETPSPSNRCNRLFATGLLETPFPSGRNSSPGFLETASPHTNHSPNAMSSSGHLETATPHAVVSPHGTAKRTIQVSHGSLLRCPSYINEAADYGRRVHRVKP